MIHKAYNSQSEFIGLIVTGLLMIMRVTIMKIRPTIQLKFINENKYEIHY